MKIPLSSRAGVTIPELLVGLVIVAFVGMGFTRLLVSQTRFFDQQGSATNARNVARSSLNRAISDIRMVEAEGGVTAADSMTLSLRTPYALGVSCGSSTLALLPADSLMYVDFPSGYAWRDANGAYTYVESGVSLGVGSSTVCANAGVTDLTAQGGKVVTIVPALPAAAGVGTVVLLTRRVKYELKTSQIVPGKLGLFRTQTDPVKAAEEIAAPFDANSRFMFFVANSSSAQNTPGSDLTKLRGVELRLNGQSERTGSGASGPRTEKFTTAIFFKNRRS